MGVNHSTIGHNWAHQLKKRQYTGTFRFEGEKIYSYYTVIGQIVTLSNGTKIYLLNDKPYSNSTSKHQNHAFSAIPVDAIQFSIDPEVFVYDWGGIWNFKDEDMMQFVKKYIQYIFKQLLKFKTSKSYVDETTFSLAYWQGVLDIIELTHVTTIPKIISKTIADYRMFWGCTSKQEAHEFRKMLKALHNQVRDVKQLVIATFGQKVWDDYVKRTAGPRKAEKTCRINAFIGNSYRVYGTDFYRPDAKKTRATSYLMQRCRGEQGRSVTAKQLETWRKKGVLTQKLLAIYHNNLSEALKQGEINKRDARKTHAKNRLERHLGMQWPSRVWPKNPKQQGDYCGTVVVYHDYHHRHSLTDEEYQEFVGLSNEEKKQWIHAKRLWMLEQLQEDERRHQAYELEYATRQQELLLARLQHEKEIRELREYVVNKQTEGPQGYRDLFHEGLWQASYNSERSIFYGGNALLRVASNREMVITSKGICIPVEECKRLWTMIHYWHTHNITFVESEEEVRAASNNWSINRYQDDIMIAGCHAIHYNEMRYIAEQLNLI